MPAPYTFISSINHLHDIGLHLHCDVARVVSQPPPPATRLRRRRRRRLQQQPPNVGMTALPTTPRHQRREQRQGQAAPHVLRASRWAMSYDLEGGRRKQHVAVLRSGRLEPEALLSPGAALGHEVGAESGAPLADLKRRHHVVELPRHSRPQRTVQRSQKYRREVPRQPQRFMAPLAAGTRNGDGHWPDFAVTARLYMASLPSRICSTNGHNRHATQGHCDPLVYPCPAIGQCITQGITHERIRWPCVSPTPFAFEFPADHEFDGYNCPALQMHHAGDALLTRSGCRRRNRGRVAQPRSRSALTMGVLSRMMLLFWIVPLRTTGLLLDLSGNGAELLR